MRAGTAGSRQRLKLWLLQWLSKHWRRSQIETLQENEVFDSTGRIVNADLHNYLRATSADSPIIDFPLVDSYEPEGPFGAKEGFRVRVESGGSGDGELGWS